MGHSDDDAVHKVPHKMKTNWQNQLPIRFHFMRTNWQNQLKILVLVWFRILYRVGHKKIDAILSAVIDCRNYRLSEYSRNDTTCRLLMAISIHKRHVKITASSYRQDVTLMLNGIKTRRQPGGKFVSDVNIAHG